MRRLPALLFLLVFSPAALAWSALGHRLVGDLAQRHLQPATARQVRALLAGEAEPTLAGVADWADTLRSSDPAAARRTSRWHYVNLGPGCDYEPVRDCADGDCVVGAIRAQQAILGDRRQAREARRDALKWLVHLVADAHQPLHAGNRPDRGGNRFQVSLRTDLPPGAWARDRYRDGVMGTNLHAVWDYYILATPRIDARAYARRLDAMPWPPKAAVATPAAWAEESCRITNAPTFYPRQHRMDRGYLDAERPLAERRIREAAFRLARLLDATLGAPAR
jgi:nuclease S1